MIRSQILRRFIEQERGLALVEFALSVPILLLLFLATFQITDALSCSRKVTITTRAVADLTSQYASISASNVNDILNASAKIMAPYNSASALVRVSELGTDINGNTTVIWSEAINGTRRATGSSYALPSTIKQLPATSTDKTYIIVAEMSYAYRPPVNFGIVGPLGLSDIIYMNPRISSSVIETP
jgi:Flp pilus assembly protein TadG